jgi:hypothetical protein
MDTVEYTLWNIETREVYSTGVSVVNKAVAPEGHQVHYGERVDFETHIFGDDDLPVPRSAPRAIPADEASVLVNRERQRRIEVGKDFGGVWVTGSDRDQVNLLALKDTAKDLQAAGIDAAVIPFRDGNNIEHILTAAEIIDLANAGKMYVSAIYQASWALKAMDPFPVDYTDDAYWP